MLEFFFFQAEDGIRYHCVTGVQTCALPISMSFGASYKTTFPLLRTRRNGPEPILSLKLPKRATRPNSALHTSDWSPNLNATTCAQTDGALISKAVCAA